MKKLLLLALALGISGQVWADKTITVENVTSKDIFFLFGHSRPGSDTDYAGQIKAGASEDFMFRDMMSYADFPFYGGHITMKSPKTNYKIVEKNGKLILE